MWVLLGEIFPNENSRSRSCYFRRDELDCEFHRHLFSSAQGGRSDRRLRFLCDRRSDLPPFRVVCGA
jgi:hypothetical protein